jgi:hypothetical protein
MPTQIRILPQVIHKLVNQNFLLTFFHKNASLHCFIFIADFIGVIIFSISDSILKISGKNFSLSLHLVEIVTDPDPDLDPEP